MTSDGIIVVMDLGNHRLRKIMPNGEVLTLAGSGQGFADGSGTAAQFHAPHGVAIDGNGHIVVADTVNHRIRRVAPDGTVTTLAGSGARGFADGAAQRH